MRLATPAFIANRGFTILEVMVSAALVALGLGSILTMSAQSIQTLRAARQVAAGSQILQQRIEAIRSGTWPEISSAVALARLMETPAPSEVELGSAGVTEFLTLSVPAPDGIATSSARSFRLRRAGGAVTVEMDGDFSSEPTLLLESVVVWQGKAGPQRRALRTILCRAGLTRSGVFGSEVGRPATGAP